MVQERPGNSILRTEFFQAAVSWAKGYAHSFGETELSPILLIGGVLRANQALQAPDGLQQRERDLVGAWRAYSSNLPFLAEIISSKDKMPITESLQKIISGSSGSFVEFFEALIAAVRQPAAQEDDILTPMLRMAQALGKIKSIEKVSACLITASAYLLMLHGRLGNLPSLANYLVSNRSSCEAIIKKNNLDKTLIDEEVIENVIFSDEVAEILKSSASAVEKARGIINLGLKVGTALIDEVCTAYHEAGHAVVSNILRPSLTVTKITIVPDLKEGAAGITYFDPTAVFWSQATTTQELHANICALLAGRAAQLIKFGPSQIDEGANSDIEEATRQAWEGVAISGLDAEIGPVNIKKLRELGENSSGWIIDQAQKRVQETLKSEADRAEHILRSNWTIVENVVRELLVRKSIDEEIFFHVRRLRTLQGNIDTKKVISRYIQRRVVFAKGAEIIETPEGPVRCQAGDAIVSDGPTHKWPIRIELFRNTYIPAQGTIYGTDGIYEKHQRNALALKVEDSTRIDMADDLGVLRGEPGDWIIDYGDGDLAIVTQDMFERLYEVIE